MRKNVSLVLICALSTMGPLAFAASGGHHGEAAIPWKAIGIQVFNFSIVLAVLFFLLKKKAAQHFQERQASYTALLKKAELAKTEAEKNKREIAERLSKLEANAEASIAQAKAEAEELRRKIIEDAKDAARKMEEESKRTIEFELMRARQALRDELLYSSLEQARKNIRAQVKDPDLKRLQSEFVQKVQVVGQ